MSSFANIVSNNADNVDVIECSLSMDSSIYFDCKVKGFDKDQDFCQIGKGVDKHKSVSESAESVCCFPAADSNPGKQVEFEYIVLCDGHGDINNYNKYFTPLKI